MKQGKKQALGEDIRVVDSVPHSTYNIAQVPVHFPFKPYTSQLDMMSHIVRALSKSQNSLIESPTGSGKSLALLCAALGWRRNFTEKLRLARSSARKIAMRFSQHNSTLAQTEQDPDPKSSSTSPGLPSKALPGVVGRILQEAKGNTIPAGLSKSDIDTLRDYQENYAHITHAPTIYFGSRTHKQVSQLVTELRDKTPYRVAMAVLGSRKQECIHPKARTAFSIDDTCKELRMGGSCEFHANHRRLLAHESFAQGGELETWDIEDIVGLGRRLDACPYYASHELAKHAALVFCPYSYIVDPVVRDAVRIPLDGNVVILDEAHNIEGATREAASIEISDAQLVRLARECRAVLRAWPLREHYARVLAMAMRILAWLRSNSAADDVSGSKLNAAVWPTPDVSLVAMLEQMGFTEASVSQLKLDCTAIEEDAKNPSPARRKTSKRRNQESELDNLSGSSLQILNRLTITLRRICSTESTSRNDYRLAKVQDYPFGTSTSMPANQSLASRTLALWAMRPGIIFSELSQLCHSIVLTSGTLSPLASYASELRTEFASSLETDHIINPDRLLAMSIQHGPSGKPLEGKYANVDDHSYQDNIGQAVASIAAKSPDGMLVFVPSFSLLNKLIARWTETGTIDTLAMYKKLFIESQGDSRSSFNRLLAQYKQLLNARNDNSGSGGGALMFAVHRGKISEGLDFSDHLCRTIVNIGIPYPAFMDTKISLKREYNDACNNSNSENDKLLSGFWWYNTQAFRAMNQALGRCIRHKDDWGAIILLDSRMAMPHNTSKLSKWIRSHIHAYSDFDQAAQDLDLFYKRRMHQDSQVMSFIPELSRLAVS
ncbi:hypothetical protein EV175_003089 [Coemansia sp. RSA 1933]|nr:hypothetical protein EV175_003089 [Coemansia sp. RSA 1933]